MKRVDKYLNYKRKQIDYAINKMKRFWVSSNMINAYKFEVLLKGWIMYEEDQRALDTKKKYANKSKT